MGLFPFTANEQASYALAMTHRCGWRGGFDNDEVEALHALGFGHEQRQHDWAARLDAHSLGWVCARSTGILVGFVNVAWDGGSHAFILDIVVAEGVRRGGVGSELVRIAVREAAAAGCEWVHVDFEGHLKGFYLGACGFDPTDAGLVGLAGH